MSAQPQATPATPTSFADRLRGHREAAGLSQAELATKIGVSQTAIGQWERGQFTPRGRNVNALATALSVGADELRGKAYPAISQGGDECAMIVVDFAKRLRAGRAAARLSLADVGELVGVSAQAVHAWETGKSAPALQNMIATMEVLGIASPITDESEPQGAAVSELLMAELIIVTMLGTLTAEQKAAVQVTLQAAGVAGADMIRSSERRAAIVAGGAA